MSGKQGFPGRARPAPRPRETLTRTWREDLHARETRARKTPARRPLPTTGKPIRFRSRCRRPQSRKCDREFNKDRECNRACRRHARRGARRDLSGIRPGLHGPAVFGIDSRVVYTAHAAQGVCAAAPRTPVKAPVKIAPRPGFLVESKAPARAIQGSGRAPWTVFEKSQPRRNFSPSAALHFGMFGNESRRPATCSACACSMSAKIVSDRRGLPVTTRQPSRSSILFF